jgi:hypothetical protein
VLRTQQKKLIEDQTWQEPTFFVFLFSFPTLISYLFPTADHDSALARTQANPITFRFKGKPCREKRPTKKKIMMET